MRDTLTIDALYDGVRLLDDLVAKSIGVDALAQSARIETKLREYLLAQWEQLAKKAAREARERFMAMKGDLTDKDAETISNGIGKTMEQWAGIVEERFTRDMRAIYKLSFEVMQARISGKMKAPIEYPIGEWDTGTVTKAEPPPNLRVGFGLQDKAAMNVLGKHQTYWIGEHYSANVGNAIASTTKKFVMEQGRSNEVAGRALERLVGRTLSQVTVPKGFNGTQARYFEGLVSNAATTSRAISSVNVMRRAGYTEYRIVNPKDQRTCDRCEILDGKRFKVADGSALANRILGAKNPTSIRTIQPFLSISDTLSLVGGARGPMGPSLTSKLEENGNALPPFHLNCFIGSTPVLSRRGLIPISSIRVGDEVLTHKLRWKKVSNVMSRDFLGDFINIEGIISTADHPYLIRRDGCNIFSAVIEDDLVGKVNPCNIPLRELRQDHYGNAVANRNEEVLFSRIYVGESGARWLHEGACLREGSSALRSMWENSFDSFFSEGSVSLLFQRVQENIPYKRGIRCLFRMWKKVLADSVSFRKYFYVFAGLSNETMEEIGLWSQRWGEEGTIFRCKKSHVWQKAWARALVYVGDTLARYVKIAKHLGRQVSQRIINLAGTFSLRVPTFLFDPGLNIPSGFLFAETENLDRGQRMVQTEGSSYTRAISRTLNLCDPFSFSEIGFVPIGFIQRFSSHRVVWNLTVEEDESFLVGEQLFAVHNCRCSIDVVSRIPGTPVVAPRPPVAPPPAPPIAPPVSIPIEPPVALPIEAPAAVPVEAPVAVIPAAPLSNYIPPRPIPLLPTPAAPEVLQQEVKKFKTLWDQTLASNKKKKISKFDFPQFRRNTEDFFEKQWGLSLEPSRTGGARRDLIERNARTRKYNGWRDGFEGITLRGKRFDDMSASIGATSNGTMRDGGFFTFIHESVHGSNRLLSSAYNFEGKALCEASTEITARKILVDITGHKFPAGESIFTMSRSYGQVIDDLVNSVTKATGWAKERAWTEIERASHLMSTSAASTIASHYNAPRMFIELLPGNAELTREQKVALQDALSKLRVL
jgi:hypothetical protein